MSPLTRFDCVRCPSCGVSYSASLGHICEREPEPRIVLNNDGQPVRPKTPIVQIGCNLGVLREHEELEQLVGEIVAEMLRGDGKHKPHPGPKRGFGALRNEYNELQTEIEAENGTPESIRTEAIQVAAMALKFLRDCC